MTIQELSTTLAALSEKLRTLEPAFSEIGWAGHANAVLSMAGHLSIYSHQLGAPVAFLPGEYERMTDRGAKAWSES